MCSLCARTIAWRTRMSGPAIASSAARHCATFSSSETSNGSRSTAVRCVALAGATGASCLECRPAAARAKVHARSAASRAPSAESRRSHAKPHAPFTSTRTPIPSLSESESRSTRPFFVATNWLRLTTTRASAYSAPAPVAASTAAAAQITHRGLVDSLPHTLRRDLVGLGRRAGQARRSRDPCTRGSLAESALRNCRLRYTGFPRALVAELVDALG